MSVVDHPYFEPTVVALIVVLSVALPGAPLNLVLFIGSLGGLLYLVERVTDFVAEA